MWHHHINKVGLGIIFGRDEFYVPLLPLEKKWSWSCCYPASPSRLPKLKCWFCLCPFYMLNACWAWSNCLLLDIWFDFYLWTQMSIPIHGIWHSAKYYNNQPVQKYLATLLTLTNSFLCELFDFAGWRIQKIATGFIF